MKKKGLIISTVVMVVVLIASLTTATYAWFTADSKTAVTPISFEVTTNSDLTIGVSKTNRINSGASIGQNLFMSGDGLTYKADTNEWQGGEEGLGYAVNTGLDLRNMTQALFTGVPYVAENANATGTIDETLNPEGTWVKANGNGTAVTKNTVVTAVANDDYLDVAFGVAAAKANISKVKIVIGVNPTDGNTVLGMNAAISYVYKIDDGPWSGIVDIYGTEGSATTAITGAGPTSFHPIAIPDITWNAGAITKVIDIFGDGTAAVTQGEIHQIHIKLFINGKDGDCNNSAANVGSVISINFVADTVSE